MKRLLLLSAIIVQVLWLACSAQTKVFLLPVDDEIGSTTWRFVHSGLAEARHSGADIVIVHLNTYGGAVDAADSIRTALMNTTVPVVAFIDNNAASAGALIALACDSVYMVPGASMGAATVVSGTDGTAMPDKYQSYMRAKMRTTAESHGKVATQRGDSTTLTWRRDPLIAEAMVDSRIVVPGLIDSTKVLTFTTDEAIQWGYADGCATDIDNLLTRHLGITGYTIERFEPHWTDHLIGFLTNPAFKAILISLILLGIYWEVQMPGAGFPITLSVIAALLYFLPAFLDGGSGVSAWAVVLFAVGVILLVLEIFVIPGFGVAGIAGIAAIAVALIWVLAENITFTAPAGRSMTFLSAVAQAMMWFGGAIALTVGVSVWLTSRRGPKAITRHTELTHSQNISEGYIGVDMAVGAQVGKRAVAVTPLHPSGKITIDGHDFDAVAERGYIDAGQTVTVTRHNGAQLYVTPLTGG